MGCGGVRSLHVATVALKDECVCETVGHGPPSDLCRVNVRVAVLHFHGAAVTTVCVTVCLQVSLHRRLVKMAACPYSDPHLG